MGAEDRERRDSSRTGSVNHAWDRLKNLAAPVRRQAGSLKSARADFVRGDSIIAQLPVKRALANIEDLCRSAAIATRLTQCGFDCRALDLRHRHSRRDREGGCRRGLIGRLDCNGTYPRCQRWWVYFTSVPVLHPHLVVVARFIEPATQLFDLKSQLQHAPH